MALGVGTLLVWDPEFTTDQITLEVVSAFGTVGLSTGITAHLSNVLALALVATMYLGRIGPITLVAALAAKSVVRRFDYPEERPFIG
ncbi:potassium transporter TrkG [Corynebacterium incognita]|uniref:potassium transporter TrkG n=1 Tax=Corynebacterium incognita TaxID=2754725 RepID=UPI0031B59881